MDCNTYGKGLVVSGRLLFGSAAGLVGQQARETLGATNRIFDELTNSEGKAANNGNKR
jgi:hypothetical protein